MKKILCLATALCAVSTVAQAGQYMPYVGFDYVNRTLNLAGKYEDAFAQNYDIANLNAGIKFVDVASIEAFVEKSAQEKEVSGNRVTRGKVWGYGADVLVNAYNLSDATIYGSVGYGRMSTKLKKNGKGDDDTSNVIRLGFGGEINVSPEWGVRAMYRYSLADGETYSNSKEFTIGARYYFY